MGSVERRWFSVFVLTFFLLNGTLYRVQSPSSFFFYHPGERKKKDICVGFPDASGGTCIFYEDGTAYDRDSLAERCCWRMRLDGRSAPMETEPLSLRANG